MSSDTDAIQNRVIGLVRRAVKQLEDIDSSVMYTRQQVQSIESIQKTLLIINNLIANKIVDDEMIDKDDDELKNILGYDNEED